MKLRFLFLLLALLLPELALADGKPQAVTFTLSGGYLFFSPKRDLTNTAIPTALAVTYNFDEKWAMQLAADLINSNSGDPSKHHVHGFAYLWDTLYRFPTYHSFDPYVMAGFNVISLKPINSQPVNQGGMNAGVGTQFFKSKDGIIALSAEARDLYTFSGGKNDVLLNLGINFIWQ